MNKVGVLLAVLATLSLTASGGAYLPNDTGESVVGLRVVFSEPVVLTGFGDLLGLVEPEGESTEFTFSGGDVGLWDSHWVSWEPATASLAEHEWIFPERSHPGIHGLSREYMHEFHDSFSSPDLLPEWRIDNPDGKSNFDPAVIVELVSGAIRIHGYSAPPSLRQSGFRLSGFQFAGNADFEVVVRVSVAVLDPRLTIELIDTINQSALAQLNGNSAGFDLVHYNMYREEGFPAAVRVLDNTSVSFPHLSKSVVIRLQYSASDESLTSRMGSDTESTIRLAWVGELLLLRVFAWTRDDLQGDIDLLIEEVHVGTDVEMLP